MDPFQNGSDIIRYPTVILSPEYRIAAIRHNSPEHRGKVNHGRGFQRNDVSSNQERQIVGSMSQLVNMLYKSANCF